VNTLPSLSQAQLIEIILRLREEVAALQARVAELEEENRKLREGKGTPLAVKPSRPKREERERKHRGRAFVRRREAEPTERRAHAIEQCPECGRKLQGGWEHARREVIEVVFQTRVIEHVFVGRWCGICQKRWVPTAASAELGVQGRRRFGASVQALVTLLHLHCRMPIRMIRDVLWEMGELSISNGGVEQLLQGMRGAGEPSLAAIKARLRASAAVHGDETGWREDGKNGYLWGFFTDTDRYFEYRKTRASLVPEEILGKGFRGVCTCDFYGGYNPLPRLQRCWVHLLRDVKELVARHPERPEVGVWREAVRGLYQEAKEFSAESPRRRRRARRDFEERAEALARPYAQMAEAPQRVLSARILKHLGELFVFVEHPHVSADNNLAERSLRPSVIARKVSGGTRSAKGSDTRMGLMSLLSTWRAKGQPLLKSCREVLLPTPAH
jgi:ribosomal protein L34E